LDVQDADSKPVEVCFIAVAAYAHPQTVVNEGSNNGKKGVSKYSGKICLSPKVADKTKQKIRTILNIALEHGHDSLVLSAFGCGAYGNPPEHMAKLFHNIICKEYVGCFKHIVFAIIEDANSRKKSIIPKETCCHLSKYSVQLKQFL